MTPRIVDHQTTTRWRCPHCKRRHSALGSGDHIRCDCGNLFTVEVRTAVHNYEAWVCWRCGARIPFAQAHDTSSCGSAASAADGPDAAPAVAAAASDGGTIQDTLRGWRRRRGLTQAEFARITGYSAATFCRYERANRMPPVRSRRTIERTLNLAPGQILWGVPEPSLRPRHHLPAS